MAHVNIELSVESIAGIINNMDVKEIETLCILLNDKDQELLKRKKRSRAAHGRRICGPVCVSAELGHIYIEDNKKRL